MARSSTTELDHIRRFADELPIAIWVACVPSGQLAYSNRRFREIMGMEARGDVEAGGYAEPYGICDRAGELYPEQRMPFVRAIEARETVEVDDIVIHRRDGGRVNVRAFARPLFDDAGEMTHVSIAFIDITREVQAEEARRESEARLLQAHRLESVGTLAGGIAHDFNNLLTVLRLVAAQLRMNEHDERKLLSLMTIENIAQRAADLTQSLLDFSRRGAHSKRRALSLVRMVQSLGEIIRRTVGQDVEVELVLDCPSGMVVGDFAQLEQVIMNLVVNARDAIAGLAHRKLVIRVSEHPAGTAEQVAAGLALDRPHVRLEVIDSGRGIPVEVRPRIFEPYFTTKTAGARRGTGLGLATVYGIVMDHEGVIAAEKGPGGLGTRMVVSIPSAKSVEVGETIESAARSIHPGQGTILVVDDDGSVRTALASALQSLGYHTLEAHDGTSALHILRDRPAELSAVLLDMIMPGMTGAECYDQLRPLEPDLPVVLMSGNADEKEVQLLLDRGASGFLPKPYSLECLSETLATVLPAQAIIPT